MAVSLDGVRPPTSIARCSAVLGLLCGLLALPLHAAGAKPAPKSGQPRPVLDLEELAQHRPRKCAVEEPDPGAPPGWQEDPALCVWQGRLQMRRWQISAQPPAGSCLGPAAQWWSWQRQRTGIPAAASGAAWRSGWKSQFLAGPAGADRVRIAVLETGKGNVLTATEFTWTPSPRPATRAWQEGRWKLFMQRAASLRPPESRDLPGDDAAALRNAWERNLNGRAGEIAPEAWRWLSDGKCLRMQVLAPHDLPLPLPYAREDARLEQRAAMQIQLARRHPGATWLVPFRMLDAPAGGRRDGAKYAAVWTERTHVMGQLWIPEKSGGKTLRLRIEAALPARYETPAGLAASVGAMRAIERELTGMAIVWSASHER
jgi:hypothetical protein